MLFDLGKNGVGIVYDVILRFFVDLDAELHGVPCHRPVRLGCAILAKNGPYIH